MQTHISGPVLRYIVSDPTRLRQILVNLLSNVIKFTPSGGSVITEVSMFILKKAGAHMVSAENGEQGIKKALAEHFDIILMDILIKSRIAVKDRDRCLTIFRFQK